MPNTLLYRRYWQRVRDQQNSLRVGVLSALPLKAADPTENVGMNTMLPGTLPEQMLAQVFIERNIHYLYGFYIGDFPWTPDHAENVRPDFILPYYNIIIEVQGVYWHTRSDSFQSDYRRALFLTALGFKVYTITDQELMMNPYSIYEVVPELRSPVAEAIGKPITNKNAPNSAAGLRGARRKWPKNIVPKFSGAKRPGVVASTKPMSSKTPTVGYRGGQIFSDEFIDVDLAAQWKQYGQQWSKYMYDLKDYMSAMMGGGWGDLIPQDTLKYWQDWEWWWKRFFQKGFK